MSALNFPNSYFDFHIKFFRKSYSPEEIIEKLSEKQIDETNFSRIRCPSCKWRSRKNRAAGFAPICRKILSTDVLLRGILLKRAVCVPDVFISGVGRRAFRVMKIRRTKIGT